MSEKPVPAAQYLRMSTEHQRYSIENQADAIQRYAAQHGVEIVATYVDAGRSGLVLRHRSGLQNLLRDVVSGSRTYRVILVYDVSRWGRFQDTDEAAHYEFLCKQAGVPVHYCAESFVNDGTLAMTIVKVLKRAMAGEYSRELGVRVYAGKHRIAQLGFRVGGQPGLGLRRLLVGEDGAAKGILDVGQVKAITTDRIVLVPGPAKEVRVVRRIFKMAMTCGPTDIMRYLNRRHIDPGDGNEWRYARVRYLLSNPKYVGSNVWGRTTAQLQKQKRRVDPERWATCEQAFTPLIDVDTFNAVQRQLAVAHRRHLRLPDDVLISRLRQLLTHQGRLTQRSMYGRAGSASTYIRHFGSLARAYQLAGFHPSSAVRNRVEVRAAHSKMRTELQQRIAATCPDHLTHCELGQHRQAVMVDGLYAVAIVICRGFRNGHGEKRWRLLRLASVLRDRMTLLCLAESGYRGYSSYWVMPRIDKKRTYDIKREDDPWLQQGRRAKSLKDFYTAVTQMRAEGRVRLRED
jgi:DNA invertase Pin-like site-specific DNA recombinase